MDEMGTEREWTEREWMRWGWMGMEGGGDGWGWKKTIKIEQLFLLLSWNPFRNNTTILYKYTIKHV